MTPRLVPLSQPKNPHKRRIVNAAKLAALKDSLFRDGLKEPLHLSARMNVISGTCRFDLLKELGVAEALCFVHEDITDDAAELRALETFDTKSDRHVVDKAFAAAEFRERHGMTWGQAGQALSLSAATMSRYKQLTNLPQPVLDAMRRDDLSMVLAVEIGHAPEDKQLGLLQTTLTEKLTLKDLRAIVKGRKAKRKPVLVTVGKAKLELPPDLLPGELVDCLKGALFQACTKAASLNLGVDALPKILAGLGK